MSSQSLMLPALSTKGSFVDESTECAICYDSLEGTTTKPIITLRCGHKWHLECIVQQINIGSMTASNDDKRLLFNGCQCGKCGSIFGEDDHPDLPKDLIRSTDKLRSKVNALIDENNLLKGLSHSNQDDVGGGNEPSREALYKEARRKYAFYLCSHCKDPYFGGTIDCADGFRSPAESLSRSSAGVLPETRLCPACAPQSQTICQNPSEHGKFLTWKCRFCCKPSTTVCYGNVHFCDNCHDKNSSGTTIEALPCPGDSCPYPKPPGGSSEQNNDGSNHRCRRFHSNGPRQDCEQVYSCVLCDSIGEGASHDSNNSYQDPLAIEAGSRNFLINPSGEDGFGGWRQLNPRMSWSVEQQDHRGDEIVPPLLQTPVLDRNHENGTNQYRRPPITTNFVSSYDDCIMAQTVDLSNVLLLGSSNQNTNSESGLPRVVRIEVSARYTGRTDCESVFALQAVLSDYEPTPAAQRRHNNNSNNNRRPRITPPQRLSSGTLEAPPGVYWERASLEFSLDTTGNVWMRPMVTVIVFGKDRRFWQGNFGSKVADITVRVVGGTPEEIEAVLKPEEIEDLVKASGEVFGSLWVMVAVAAFAVLLLFSKGL